jgi:hypothetical protein
MAEGFVTEEEPHHLARRGAPGASAPPVASYSLGKSMRRFASNS